MSERGPMDAYVTFLERKARMGEGSGFEPLWLPDFLFPFQRALVEWAVRRGRAAIFADCGLGKTPMQLVWAENVVRKTNRPVLVLTPLAVGAQTAAEAEKFGIAAARSRDGKHSGAAIVVTNYEKLHLFDPADFAGVVCDESSILKHFKGATQQAVTAFMMRTPYRLLCTATAAPNDYVELGTSSEALGDMGQVDMLGRFFKQDPKIHTLNERGRRQKAAMKGERIEHRMVVSGTGSSWRLKGHAATPFWRWVCSWARACRKPSDLGFKDEGFILPPLTTRHHVIEARTLADGMLFSRPAFGLQEEREERRRSLEERCAFAAQLVDKHDTSIIWCHLNVEGDTLERMIPNALQVSGATSEEESELALSWFKGERCICNERAFAHKLAAWRRGRPDTGGTTTDRIELSGSPPPSSTSRSIGRSGSSISPPITEPTGSDTCAPQNSEQRFIDSAERGMQPTRTFAARPSRQRKSTGRDTRRPDSSGNSRGTEYQSTPTGASPQADAGSAVGIHRLETIGISGSTSITVTTPEDSADSSAHRAISGSASSEIAPSGSSAQPCICGHRGGPRRLISKAKIFGFGINLQSCAHVVTFADHSYEQYYQAVRRCWRFGQTRPVTVDVISAEGEQYVRENMARKAQAADAMFEELVAHMNEAQRLERSSEVEERVEVPAWL